MEFLDVLFSQHEDIRILGALIVSYGVLFVICNIGG